MHWRFLTKMKGLCIFLFFIYFSCPFQIHAFKFCITCWSFSLILIEFGMNYDFYFSICVNARKFDTNKYLRNMEYYRIICKFPLKRWVPKYDMSRSFWKWLQFIFLYFESLKIFRFFKIKNIRKIYGWLAMLNHI